jgi:hypothetical protein
MRSFVGLYWTLPVPWAGFRRLDRDVDVAAGQSRTIRYQRNLVRRHVAAKGGRLLREVTLLELLPDRATPEAVGDLRALVAAEPAGHVFCHVDFAAAHGWRQHPFLAQVLEGRECEALYPDPLALDGVTFDPVDHFRAWRNAERRHIDGKPDHARQVLAAIDALPPMPLGAMAARLNGDGLRTPTGKPWNAENLRKFIRGLAGAG